MIPAAVSFAAVIVSLGQVWVTKISKDKELELVRAQKHLELELQDAQRKRELDISAAKFVTENREAIFRGTQDERELFAKLISTLFPTEVSSPLLHRLQRASPASSQQAWQQAIKVSADGAAAISPDRKRFVTIDQGTVRVWDAETGKVVGRLIETEPLDSVQFSSDGKQLLTESIGGKVSAWNLSDLSKTFWYSYEKHKK